MKANFLIAIFCISLVFFTRAQSRASVYHPIIKTSPFANSFKKFATVNSLLFSLQKTPDINYKAPKLPFFCSLEEKSRSKFGFFLKLRAGNDETYLKITGAKNP